jgi:hypothetical protein
MFLIAVMALLAGNGCGQKNKIEGSRYVALGQVMAEKTTELCGAQGRIVLVVSQSDQGQPTAFGQAIDAFRKALGKSVQITATESVTTPAVLMHGSEPLPVADFSGLLQKYSTADYLISFVGVPVLTPAQIAQLPSARPAVVAVVTYNAPTKAMFAQKVVCVAALSRSASDPPASGTRSSQEWFDAAYQLVTADTAGSLLAY